MLIDTTHTSKGKNTLRLKIILEKVDKLLRKDTSKARVGRNSLALQEHTSATIPVLAIGVRALHKLSKCLPLHYTLVPKN